MLMMKCWLAQFLLYSGIDLIAPVLLERHIHKESICRPDDYKLRKGKMSTLPKLSKTIEKNLEQSFRELSMVEGNLLSTSKEAKTIYVTSCRESEGKSITALAMAYALADNGKTRVLLIDGNASSPKLHDFFNVDRGPGLLEVLHAGLSTNTAIKKTAYNNLAIMLYGSPSLDGELYIEKEMIEPKLYDLEQQFDYVIVDGESLSGSSRATLIAEQFDGVVVTVQCGKTKWEVVQLALSRLERIKAKVLGVVLNRRQYYIPKLFYS